MSDADTKPEIRQAEPAETAPQGDEAIEVRAEQPADAPVGTRAEEPQDASKEAGDPAADSGAAEASENTLEAASAETPVDAPEEAPAASDQAAEPEADSMTAETATQIPDETQPEAEEAPVDVEAAADPTDKPAEAVSDAGAPESPAPAEAAEPSSAEGDEPPTAEADSEATASPAAEPAEAGDEAEDAEPPATAEAAAADPASDDPLSAEPATAVAATAEGAIAEGAATAEGATTAAAATAEGATAAAAEPAKKKKKKRKRKRHKGPKVPTGPEDEKVLALRAAKESREPIEGKVIGWNNGGFHVVVSGITAFCPRSEMEPGNPKSPKGYLDQSFTFQVLEVEPHGRRVVLSRTGLIEQERRDKKAEIRDRLAQGTVHEGTVASVTEFGAFVDLGGVQGLVHVSQLSRDHVGHPSDVVEPGQKVKVKILKLEQGGKRISLSMKALEPDPWDGVAKRFSEGEVVRGVVEKTAQFGAFVALEPGLTGLLPTKSVSLAPGSSLARAFPPGKEVKVQILRLDARRRRISLAPEGSQTEGTRSDYESFRKSSSKSEGFGALAAALEKARQQAD